MNSGQDTSSGGNFFEDFFVGRKFRHATPRTITQGDSSLYIALTGSRHPIHCSEPLAQALGYRTMPVDDFLVFNLAFGKTVPDISANAIANLGYADLRFLEPVYVGDTLVAESEVIGVRETSAGGSGVVYVRSAAHNQNGVPVLSWIRWVLVRKRDAVSRGGTNTVPVLPELVAFEDLKAPNLSFDIAQFALASGSNGFWDDYTVGDRINHPAGMTLDETDHTLATKLYQNNAKVHFDALAMKDTPHGRRLVYGGHVISVCRALSYDGLENVVATLAINGGSHCAPTFAGDTLYCFTEVIAKSELWGRKDSGVLRLRLIGIRNNPAVGFTPMIADGESSKRHPDVVLDLDYSVLVPRAH